jgi:hypothetical protein
MKCVKRKKPLTLKQAYDKYPYLNPKKNTWIRQEHLDFDYIKQILNDEKALAMLNQFVKEYYNADFRESKYFDKESDRKELRRDNNGRNRCIYGRARTLGNIGQLREEVESKDSEE